MRSRIGAISAVIITGVLLAGALWVVLRDDGGSEAVAAEVRRLDVRPTRVLKTKPLVQGIVVGDGNVLLVGHALDVEGDCASVRVWRAPSDTSVTIVPLPRCTQVEREFTGFDSYSVDAVTSAGRIVFRVAYRASDTCGQSLTTVQLPAQTATVIGRYEGDCRLYYEGDAVSALTGTAHETYVNYGRARSTAEGAPPDPPTVMRVRGNQLESTGNRGHLLAAHGERWAALREGGPLGLCCVDGEIRTFPAATDAELTPTKLIAVKRRQVRVYDVERGRLEHDWHLGVDPFRPPALEYFGPYKVPQPTLHDATSEFVVYSTGRQLRVLRLSDGRRFVLHEQPFDRSRYESSYDLVAPYDAQFDDDGLYYSFAHTVAFVPIAALRAAIERSEPP